MTEVIRKVLTGSGECSEVNWKFLGLAMPAWVLICAPGARRRWASSDQHAGFARPRPANSAITSNVNAVERVDLRDPHRLIDLVNRRVDDAQLHHLGSQRRDEPPV